MMMDYIELSEPDIIRILGERFRDYRLNCQLTQKDLAARTGISLKTISNFESGKASNITMINFLTLLRTVGQLQNIDELLPEVPLSPYARLAEPRTRYRKGGTDEE